MDPEHETGQRVGSHRFWLIVAIALAALALVALLITLSVVAPPQMDPVPIPSVSSV